MVRIHDDATGGSPADQPLECIDPEIGELLPFHADGTIGARDRQIVSSHLAACARCADEERLMRGVAQGISSLRLDPDPRAAVDAGPSPRPHRLIASAVAAAAIAALVVVALVGSHRRAAQAELRRAEVAALEQRVHQLEGRNASLAQQVAREQVRIESPFAGIPIASPPNF